MTDPGIVYAAKQSIPNPLPLSWLGRVDMPPAVPAWASISRIGDQIFKNLQAQIAYDLSGWNYSLVGTSNKLGRYQFSTTLLETYGLLAPNSNRLFGVDCVNYLTCWNPVILRKNTNGYSNYIYNADSASAFLAHSTGQEHLAYQISYDIYNDLLINNGIKDTDSTDIVAGMIYVGWALGAGSPPSANNLTGTGAYAWRYFNIGSAQAYYNSGRYAATVLSQ